MTMGPWMAVHLCVPHHTISALQHNTPRRTILCVLRTALAPIQKRNNGYQARAKELLMVKQKIEQRALFLEVVEVRGGVG